MRGRNRCNYLIFSVLLVNKSPSSIFHAPLALSPSPSPLCSHHYLSWPNCFASVSKTLSFLSVHRSTWQPPRQPLRISFSFSVLLHYGHSRTELLRMIRYQIRHNYSAFLGGGVLLLSSTLYFARPFIHSLLCIFIAISVKPSYNSPLFTLPRILASSHLYLQ